jgi:hypothetical protein
MLLAALATVWLAIRLGMPQPSPEATASHRAPEATSTSTPTATAGSTTTAEETPGASAAALMPGTWRQTAVPPIDGRMGHALAWTGTEVLVWGGTASNPQRRWLPRDGAAYNPATDTWRMIPLAPIAGRERPLAAWSGSQLLVWGGVTGVLSAGAPPVADGAAYDPATDRWRRLPAAPLGLSDAVGGWLDGALFVVTSDGTARYGPRDDTWTALDPAPVREGGRVGIIAAGAVMVFAFGDGSGGPVEGAVLQPATGAWTELAAPFLTLHAGLSFVPAGDRVLVPEPRFRSRNLFLQGGLAMELGSWRPIEPCSGAARGPAWTGRYVIGVEDAYDTVSDSCLTLPPAPPRAAPFDGSNGRIDPIGVWTGTEYVTWSGLPGGEGAWVPSDGAIFRPEF